MLVSLAGCSATRVQGVQWTRHYADDGVTHDDTSLAFNPGLSSAPLLVVSIPPEGVDTVWLNGDADAAGDYTLVWRGPQGSPQGDHVVQIHVRDAGLMGGSLELRRGGDAPPEAWQGTFPLRLELFPDGRCVISGD